MRKLSVLISCVAVGAMGLSALAQDKKPDQPPAGDRQPRGNRPGGPGGGGMMRGQLPPERAKAAWEAEATGVAKHAGLNEAQTKSLVAAYTAARESHAESMQKLMKEVRDAAEGNERPDPQAMQEKMQGLNKAEKEKFQKAVGATLSADQAAKVLASLGSFNGQWDRWVDALGEFKLDPAKNQQAMDALETFVLASEKARAGDRETMRESMQAARESLNESMKKILNDEQFQKFESSMGRGGQRGGGPGGQDGGQPQRRRPRDGGGNGGGGGGGGGGGKEAPLIGSLVARRGQESGRHEEATAVRVPTRAAVVLFPGAQRDRERGR